MQKDKHIEISVIIGTFNRDKKIRDTIKSILKNNFKNYELIIIDQSKNNLTEEIVKKFIKKYKKIKYFRIKEKGRSKALNFGIKKSKGNILSFTDDDCIVSKNWLNEIYLSFKKNKNISCVTGRIIPYFKKSRNKSLICPLYFLNKKSKIISKLCYHAKNIGFGANMAVKKKDLIKINLFNELLGIGSIGKSADDAEIFIKLLIKKLKIFYNPKIIVYHNKFLDKIEYRKNILNYIHGELSCYGYFSLNGYKFAKKIIIRNIKESVFDFKKTIKLKDFFYFKKIFYRISGLIVSLFIYIIKKIKNYYLFKKLFIKELI